MKKALENNRWPDIFLQRERLFSKCHSFLQDYKVICFTSETESLFVKRKYIHHSELGRAEVDTEYIDLILYNYLPNPRKDKP